MFNPNKNLLQDPMVSATEEWWQKIMQNWKRYIKPCLSIFLPLKDPPPIYLKFNGNLGQYLEELIRERNPRISYWLKKAFFDAPDNPEVIGIRGWMQLLDLVSSAHLLYDGLKIQEELEELEMDPEAEVNLAISERT